MSSYFAVIIFLWLLIGVLIKYFNIKLYSKGQFYTYFVGLIVLFVIPGFIVDWVAVKLKWYVFPQTTTYLWRTSIGIPIEEILFFITVPVLILVLWKICKKLFP